MMTAAPRPDVFNARVWEIVRTIPRGRVTTYGRIAELVGPPPGIEEEVYRAYGARWVGTAMAASPSGIPWQRVVNAQGRISIRSGGGHMRQRALLEAEGIEFDDQERVDLNRFGWGLPPVMRQGSFF